MVEDLKAQPQALHSVFIGLKQVVQIAHSAQARLDRELATNFSAVRALKLGETALSRVIAFLLDPNETHGQGTRFLKGFLDILALPNGPTVLDKCSVAPEHLTSSGRRIDIVIWIGDFVIGIENKPFAADLDDQVNHYCEYLAERYRDRWAMVYLSGVGQPPPPHSITDEARERLREQGRLRMLSYARPLEDPPGEFPRVRSLTEWLTGCIKVCEAERVKWFLRDFLDYVQTDTRFEGAKPMEEEVVVAQAVDFILSTRQVHLALQIEKAIPIIRIQLMKRFLTSIVDAVRASLGQGWDVTLPKIERELLEPYATLWVRRSSWPEETGAALESQQSDWRSMALGVKTQEESWDGHEGFHAVVSQLMPAGKPGEPYWPCFERVTEPFANLTDDSFLVRMLDLEDARRSAEKLARRLVDLARAIEPLLPTGGAV
jgi:hypothetical protein